MKVKKEKIIKDKTRPLTLIAGIVTIILGVLIAISSVVIVFVAIDNSDPLFLLATLGLGFFIYVLLGVVVLAVGVGVLIFGIAQLRLSTLPNFEYVNRKGTVVGSIVFYVLILGMVAFFSFVGNNKELNPLMFASILPLLCAIFILVDWSRFVRGVNSGKLSVDRPQYLKSNIQGINLATLNPALYVERQVKNLQDMKAKGLITDEEFNTMRQQAIDVSLGKIPATVVAMPQDPEKNIEQKETSIPTDTDANN